MSCVDFFLGTLRLPLLAALSLPKTKCVLAPGWRRFSVWNKLLFRCCGLPSVKLFARFPRLVDEVECSRLTFRPPS